MPSKSVNAFTHVFPVIAGGHGEDSQRILVSDVFGTAFSVGNGFYLTAAHVVRGALEKGNVYLGYVVDRIWAAAPVSDHELLEDSDVAIVAAASVPSAVSLPWNMDKESMLEYVQTVGFPYALDTDLASINIRAFRGNVVAGRTFRNIPSHPRIFELSFPCPRGLSGAPLFTVDKRPKIRGMICGNAATEMLIFQDREEIDDGKRVEIVERYESLQLGIAIQTCSLTSISSSLLGKSIGEHVQGLG